MARLELTRPIALGLRCLLSAVLLAAGVLPGCAAGKSPRRTIAFQGFDSVTTPDRPAELTASLRGQYFIKALPDYTVFFQKPGQPPGSLGVVKTDPDGIASTRHHWPEPGLYAVTARLDPAELNTKAVPTCDLTVGVFTPDQTFAIVDLDHTVVDAGLDHVLLGEPQPLPDSQEVLHEIAREHQILYLTHRPEFLSKRSKAFLQKWNFPSAPVLMSTLEEAASGSEAFKSGALEQLLQKFPNVRYGIGDKISDGVAYLSNDLDCFIIVRPQRLSPQQRLETADELERLDERAQVVTSWQDIRAALQHGARFPRTAMQRALREEARP